MENNENNRETWLEDLASKDIVIEHGEIKVVEESADEKKKHWLRNRASIFVLAGLPLLVAGWFVAGMFLAEVNIGGLDVSARKSDGALRSIVKQQASAYKLKIRYPDGSEKGFSLADMGLEVDTSATVRSIRKKQHSLTGRLKWWQPTSAHLEIRSNDAKHDVFIAKRTTVTIQPAKDATLIIKNGVVVIKDGTPGKHYGLFAPIDTLRIAVGTMQSTALELQVLSKRPAITPIQLAPHQAKLKEIIKQSVTFVVGSRNFQATTADISDWIEISLNENGKKIDITVNSGKVLAYINKISAPFIQPSKAQITFTREDGTAAVLTKGVEGTDVVNKSEIAASIARDLLDGKPIEEVLSVKYADFDTINADGYDKWIEVDLTTKRMYAYKQSKTLKTFLVSAGAPATPTVTGQFAIYSKIAQQDMRGLNVDGSSYFQPNVSWVNYFFQDYAIHGNYWRPLSWFGSINSSHGCVGLVDSEAQWIYSWAPIGTPVIIHD